MGGKAPRGDQEEMNKEVSLIMAEYLEGDRLIQQFKMSNPETCTIGHALRVIEGRTGRFNYQWFSGASERIFGIPRASRECFFCFGGRFSDDPKAAAFRLRYVAQHDAAPSQDQWPNFNSVPGVVEAEDEEEAEFESELDRLQTAFESLGNKLLAGTVQAPQAAVDLVNKEFWNLVER